MGPPRPHAPGHFLCGQKVTKKPHKGGTLSMGSLPYESLPHDDTKGGARRHKLRIPHPAASVRLRSLRCASFFLGKRCAGLPRSGPFGAVFTDSRWINPVRRWKRLSGLRGRGRIQRGGRSPLIGRCGRRFLGGGHSRKCPPPKRAFAYFSHERKVGRGTGVKPPKSPGHGGGAPEVLGARR